MYRIQLLAFLFIRSTNAQLFPDTVHPSRTEVITPLHKSKFYGDVYVPNESREVIRK